MSNADVVNRVYAGFAAGDINAVVATFADDIEWTEAAGFPYAGTFVGAEAIVANVFMRLGAEWDGYKAEPDLVISDGDQVAALGWYSGTYKQTGRSFRARFAHWYTVTGGKIARFEQVVDSSKVNEAL
jgi:ketosteroid isomerase-like protein